MIWTRKTAMGSSLSFVFPVVSGFEDIEPLNDFLNERFRMLVCCGLLEVLLLDGLRNMAGTDHH